MQGNVLAKASITLVRVDDGAAGKGVIKTEIFYYLSSSNTEQIGGSWVTTPPPWISGRYYWQKIKTTYTDNTVNESKPICITGAKGDAGETGKGVTSITVEFYLSTSKTGQVGGSWTTVMPSWSSGKYLWTRNKITYNNPHSIEYTTPVCDSSWEAINDIEIGARNLLRKSKGPFSNSNFKIGSWNFGEVPPVENMTYTCTIEGSLGEGKTDFVLMNSSLPSGFGKLKFIGNGTYSLTFRWPQGINAKDGIYINVLPEHTIANSTVKWIKLEKGNKSTDWSPAPEDIEDSMSDMESQIQQSITEQGTNIQSTCENIILEALTSYTKTQDLETFKETVSAQLKLLSDQMTLRFNQTTQGLNDINGELQEKFNTITKYFTFNIDGLTIGQVDSPYKVIINNDRYSMTVNDTEVMWIANGKVYTPEIEVTRGLKMFGYSIDQDQNGNINMEYVGG